jgi:hypothetical protein
MIMLQGGCGKIMRRLGNIEKNMIFFLKKIDVLKSNLLL